MLGKSSQLPEKGVFLQFGVFKENKDHRKIVRIFFISFCFDFSELEKDYIG